MTNFNSKETYLAATAEWKANYALLTKQAREARAEYNQAQSDEAKARAHYYANARNDPGSEIFKAHRASIKRVDDARSNRSSIRYEANQALRERAEMKEEAARQWRLEHATA